MTNTTNTNAMNWSDSALNRLLHDILHVDVMFPEEELLLNECGIE